MAKRLTGWRRCAFALCTVAALVAGRATAADRLMTFTEDCEYLMRTSSSSATTTNSATTYITVSGNVTITFLKTDNENTSRRSYSHWLIDGNVTFDFSQWPGGHTPWFQNSIIVRDGASLTLKCANETSYPNGMSAIYLGNSGANPDTGGAVSTYSLGGLLLDGVKALSIQYSVELLALPADATARAAIVYEGSGPNANGLVFAGNGTAARFLDEDGDLAVTNVTTAKQDVYIYERTALPDGAGLKIAAGRNVILLPAYHSTNSFGAASLNVNRVINKKEALDWDVITVKEMGPGATIKTYRSTHVAFADGVSAWGSTVNGVTTWTGGTAGEALDASGGTSANVNAKIVTKGDFAPVFYGVSSITPPIVTEGDATIDLFSAAAAPTIYANGGTATISRVDGAAFGGLEPKLWLDASVTASLSGIGARSNATVTLSDSCAAVGTLPFYHSSASDGTAPFDLVVEQWGDRRYADGTPFGSAIVAYKSGAYSGTFYKYIYPYLVASGGDCPNGMPYVCFGSKAKAWGPLYDATYSRKNNTTNKSNARLPFCSDGTNTAKLPSQSAITGVGTVVMVFGSQNGGGIAPIGVSGTTLSRLRDSVNAVDVTAETPVTLQRDRPMWLNGTQVVAEETKFSGGWDILTICTTNLSITSLSAGTAAESYSGQNYAEVIFFEEELTEAQRVNVERYLATKWGLESKYGSGAVTNAVLMSAGTNGTVKVQTDLMLAGSFSGTLELDGARVAITDQTKPGTAADVPTDGCLGWYDADTDGFCTFTSATHTYPNALQWVYNILEGTPTTSSVIPWGGGSRSPLMVASARGLGVERTWFDFNGSPSTSIGNTIRFCEYSTKAQPTESPLENVRTVIMAQDSCRGGGQPFLTAAVGGYPRRTTPDWTDAIWRVNSKVPTAYTNALVRLDGATVNDACSDGFGGCPEVLTVQAAAGAENNLTVGAFGYYGNSDASVTDSSKKRHGEVIGEILLYSRDLTDAERAKVETYLMDKWVNRLPAGYGDLSQATLTGTGSLSAAKWSQVPKIASTFSGTVSVAAVDEMKISIEADGTVTGGLVCPDATLELPAAVTATITVASNAPEGIYPIIDCDSGDTVWTFSVITPRSRTASVKLIDGAYALAVAKLGTVILVR